MCFNWNLQLSQCELAVHVLERELSEHRGHWEETMASIDHHKVFVTELTAQRDRLQVGEACHVTVM